MACKQNDDYGCPSSFPEASFADSLEGVSSIVLELFLVSTLLLLFTLPSSVSCFASLSSPRSPASPFKPPPLKEFIIRSQKEDRRRCMLDPLEEEVLLRGLEEEEEE